MNIEERINRINAELKRYFASPGNPRKIEAKELMPMFIRTGIFKSNNKDGLPIRKLLRELDNENALELIPYVVAERCNKNTRWYFADFASKPQSIPVKDKSLCKQKAERSRVRENSDEYYVISLCDEVLGLKASHQHGFDFLLSDPDKNGTRRRLKVDAFYESLMLVIEYREVQHTKQVTFFDHPDRLTNSGVTRGEQRKIYDERRRTELPKHGIRLLEIDYSVFGDSERLARNKERDIAIVRRLLSDYLH